jgi:mannose-6-phosphate isomerase-like protein (cupin superfamily)
MAFTLRAETGLEEDLVTFMNISLSDPVARAALTTTGSLGVLGARFIVDGGSSQGRFSLVEHPIVARGMAAPLHMHTREDEYSFILEGRWGFWQGGNVVFAEPGDLVYKPRDVWHTFWNATDVPARLLEIISPAGFDQFFVELAALIGSGAASPEAVAALNSGYGLHVDPDGTARIAAEQRLVTALPD